MGPVRIALCQNGTLPAADKSEYSFDPSQIQSVWDRGVLQGVEQGVLQGVVQGVVQGVHSAR